MQRAHAFEALNDFESAMDAYRLAHALAPHNDTYVYFSRECNQKQVDFILAPFQMRARDFSRIIETKWRGEKAMFPWDNDSSMANPFSDAKTGSVLRLVQRAIQERLFGINHNPPARQFLQNVLKSTAEHNSTSHDLVDAVFSDFSFSAND